MRFATPFDNREAATASGVERMMSLLPTDELQFLMELSIEPVAAKLGVLEDERAAS